MRNQGHIEIREAQNETKDPYFVGVAENGRVIFLSETYKRKKELLEGIDACRDLFAQKDLLIEDARKLEEE